MDQGESSQKIENNVSLIVARILVFLKARSLRSLTSTTTRHALGASHVNERLHPVLVTAERSIRLLLVNVEELDRFIQAVK